jgi:hypothetical protein
MSQYVFSLIIGFLCIVMMIPSGPIKTKFKLKVQGLNILAMKVLILLLVLNVLLK